MTPPATVIRAARAALQAALGVGLALVVGAIAGCGPRPPVDVGGTSGPVAAPESSAVFASTPLSAPNTLPPGLAGIDRSDASAVAAATARIWFSVDTRLDLSAHDAQLRACPLLAASYCSTIRNYPPLTGPGADWLALAADSTVITVGAADVRPAAETGPPDTPTRADRLLEVTEHLTTPTGPRPDRRVVVAVSLTRDPALGWQVTQVRRR